MRRVPQDDFVHLRGALVGRHETAADVHRVGAEERLVQAELPQGFLRDRTPNVAPLDPDLPSHKHHLAPSRKGLDQGQGVREHHDVFQGSGLEAQGEGLGELQNGRAGIEKEAVTRGDDFRGCPPDQCLFLAAVGGGNVVGVSDAEMGGQARPAMRADDLAVGLQAGEEPPHGCHRHSKGIGNRATSSRLFNCSISMSLEERISLFFTTSILDRSRTC